MEPTDPELDTRERLVRAAIEVFLEKGYGGTRVQDIARRAGYTSGAMYVHFPSRTALLGEAIILEGQRLIADLVASLRRLSPGEGKIAQHMAVELAAPGSAIDRLILEALALAARDPESKVMLSDALASFTEMIDDQIAVAQAAGLLDPEIDTAAVRDFFLTWLCGVIVVRAVGFDVAAVDGLVDVHSRLLAGLAPTA